MGQTRSIPAKEMDSSSKENSQQSSQIVPTSTTTSDRTSVPLTTSIDQPTSNCADRAVRTTGEVGEGGDKEKGGEDGGGEEGGGGGGEGVKCTDESGSHTEEGGSGQEVGKETNGDKEGQTNGRDRGGTCGEEGGDGVSCAPSEGPSESDLAHISSMLSKLPTPGDSDTSGTATTSDNDIDQVLQAVSGLLLKYPTHGQTFHVSYNAMMAVRDLLPSEPTEVLYQVQSNLLAAVANFDLGQGSMFIIDYTLNLLILLWNLYPKTLPTKCEMKHLSALVVAALNVEKHGQEVAALQFGQDFVHHLIRLLNDRQLAELDKHGAGRRLCQLLSRHEEMSSTVLQQVVVCVGMLAEVNLSIPTFIEDNIHVSLLFAAQKHHSQQMLQELIWRLLSLVVKKDTDMVFINELLANGMLSVAASIVQKKESVFVPLVKFLALCSNMSPNPFLFQLMENEDILHGLVAAIDTDNLSEPVVENVMHTCDFLSFLCSKAPAKYFGLLVDLRIVSKIEGCAKRWPESCLLQACLAIEGLIAPLPASAFTTDITAKRTEFFNENHHLFAKDMLCLEPVSHNAALAELIYVLLQKLLRASPVLILRHMGEKEFVEGLVMLFARDTSSFPQLSNRVIFTLHYFIVQMRQKECFEHLRDLCFHTFVVDLIQGSNSYVVAAASLGLLASLLSRYYTHFKSVSVLLDTQLPELMVEKCSQYKQEQSSQFGDDFGRILLSITADKEMAQQLHKRGYMDKLLGILNDGYAPVISRSIIHAVGNISLGSQAIKQELHRKDFHETLLRLLKGEGRDALLLSACCRVLHILSSGDRAKRNLVEHGCVPLLVGLMKTHREDPKQQNEVTWRSLGLLSSLGFMAVVNRRYVLTPEVIKQVTDILTSSKNGKVISYTVLVFLGVGELDDGAVQLRQLKVEESLEQAMENKSHAAQAPDLARWCKHVLEKQYLFTLSTAPDSSLPSLSLSTSHHVDWPHRLMETEAMETDRGCDDDGRDKMVLLPLEEDYTTPQHPVAPELCPDAKERLQDLGLDPDQPLFRVGRVYGSTHGFCSNCDRESISEELVIRAHSLTPHQYQDLIDAGWYRRGGVKLFRLRCNHNVYHADWETRVNALKFDRRSHKSYGRVLKRMPKDKLTVETLPTHFNREAFDLYNSYHIEKHDKPLKSMFSYAEHVVNSPVQCQTVDGVEYGTFHQLYRLDGKLVAIGIIDVVPKGIVSIYMWYDVSKSVSKYSFGVYSALKEIELVCSYHERNPEMFNYYLQGWNKLNKKLAYKSNYGPGHFYCPTIVGDWVEREEGVERSQEGYIRDKTIEQKEQEEKKAEENKADQNLEGGNTDSKDTHKTTDISKAAECNSHGDEKSQDDNKMDTTDGDEASQKKKKGSDSNSVHEGETSGDVPSTTPACHCEAYPIDLARYTARTGETSVDTRRIVVCLNHSEYHRLGDVIDRYNLPQSQVKVLDQRLSELVVTLSPRLLSQLVIDFKLCHVREASTSTNTTVVVEEEANRTAKVSSLVC